jgi:hypothetical protein
MGKIRFLATVMIVMAVVLSGCGSGKSLGQQAGEKIAEKAIEAQSGGKVDVNANDGNVTIKTEDGQAQYSAGGTVKLPENFPKELVMADDAKIIISTSADSGSTIAYVTDSSKDEIFNKYISGLAGQGWKKEMELNTGSGQMANFSQGSLKATVTIGDNESQDQPGKTLVHIILVDEIK